MSKKELIDKWESKTGAPAFETEEAAGSASNDDMYTFGYGVARTEIIEDLKQLDEPQKPVVPKFVADWFEDNKDALDVAIFIKIRDLDDEEWPHKIDFENWLDVAENKPIETLIRMKDGYEIEKLYYVPLPSSDSNSRVCYALLRNIDGKIKIDIVPKSELGVKSNTRLTKKEIESVDKKYMVFAASVEEVAE